MVERPAPTASPGAPLEDPLAEALRLVRLADERGLLVRLLGGLGFQARLPGWDGGSARAQAARRDIDLATRAADARAVGKMLVEAGYEPDTHYNALYGRKQLYFLDPSHDRPVDVLVDALEMCHRFVFSERLSADHPTLPLAELLLSKLQVVRLNPKDVVDVLALVSRYPLADHDRAAINAARIADLTAIDWGWWRTTTENLDKLRHLAASEVHRADYMGDDVLFDPGEQILRLRETIDRASKSRRWQLRARVGDRLTWYQEPEEVVH